MKAHPDGKRLYVCVGDANYCNYTAPANRRKMVRLVSIDLPIFGRGMDTI